MDKCLICHEEIKDDQELEPVESRDGYLVSATGISGYIHSECLESISDYGTRVSVFTPTGEISVNIYEKIIEGGDAEEIPAPIWAGIVELAKREIWVRTDAWRGYTDFSADAPRYKLQRLASVSILHWSDSEADEATKFEALKAMMRKLDVPFFAAFGRTSNLFASTADYFVFKRDARRIAREAKQ